MNNLKIYREKKNLTQIEVARIIGISQQAYAKWEIGTSFPRADKLPVISNLFDCSIDELFSKNSN